MLFSDDITKKIGYAIMFFVLLTVICGFFSFVPSSVKMALVYFDITLIPIFIASSYRKNDIFKTISTVVICLSAVLGILLILSAFGVVELSILSYYVSSMYSSFYGEEPSKFTFSNFVFAGIYLDLVLISISFVANTCCDDEDAIGMFKSFSIFLVLICGLISIVSIFVTPPSIISSVSAYIMIASFVFVLFTIIVDKIAVFSKLETTENRNAELSCKVKELEATIAGPQNVVEGSSFTRVNSVPMQNSVSVPQQSQVQEVVQPQVQSVVRPQIQPVVPQMQAVAQPQVQPVVQTQMQSVVPQMQAAAQPQIQPVLQPQIQPVLQSQEQSVNNQSNV